jgi:predicted AAA+ superfamily ATPase
LDWKGSSSRKPLLLRGARQTGKTYLLNEFAGNEFETSHYLNFEKDRNLSVVFKDGLTPAKVIQNISLLLNRRITPGKDLLILDEIQECSEALTSLKYFNEEMRELAVACAGSHVGLHCSEGSFPVGQVDFLDLFPMNFEEFQMADGSAGVELFKNFSAETTVPEALHQLLWEELKLYYIVGGLPEAVKGYLELKENRIDALNKARSIQRDLMRGYISDFAKHSGKQNAGHITGVFENIPRQIQRDVHSSISRYRFKGVLPNKSKHVQLAGPIDWLIKAGLVLRSYIVDTPKIPLKAYARDNTFKLFMFDTGLLGCMLDIPLYAIMNQDYGQYKGYYAENFVAQEFVAADVRDLYSWTGRHSEIEFLRVIADSVVPVEVKSGLRTKAKSLAAYTAKYSPELRIKISGNNLSRKDPAFHNYPIYLAGRIQAMRAAKDGAGPEISEA